MTNKHKNMIGHPTLALAVAAMLAVAGGWLATSCAYAGSWMEVSCENPNHSAAPIEGWSSFATGSPGYGSNNGTACGPGGPMYAILSTKAAASVGSSENLQYTPPAGSTLVGGSVDAGVKLSVAPYRSWEGTVTRSGTVLKSSDGMIVLSGRVLSPVPSDGVTVNLLVHYRGRWEPFRTPRTDAAGHFRVVYQFEGGVGRFPFRAEVPPSQANFAFGRGLSEVVDVETN